MRHGTKDAQFAPDTEQTRSLAFLRREPIHQVIDRVAQRGTDVSLIFLFSGAGWMLLNSFGQHRPVRRHHTQGCVVSRELRVDCWYGLGGLSPPVSSVRRSAKIGVKAATFGQATWGFSVLLGAVGSIWSPVMTTFGYRFLGIAFIWFAVVYLRALLARNKVSKQGVRVPRSSLSAWYASWTFCLAFGFSLVFGLDPLSFAGMHLLFLAFVTNLVYGVGYMLFPLLLRRKTLSETLAMAQVVAAILGAFRSSPFSACCPHTPMGCSRFWASAARSRPPSQSLFPN